MDFSEDENLPGPSGIERKREHPKENAQSEIVKRKRNSGEGNANRVSKKDVPDRAIGEKCNCFCFDKVGIEKIQKIFDNFWKIEDFNKQNKYISELVGQNDIKRSRVQGRSSRVSRRMTYGIKFENETFDVCRTAFYSIHGISEKRVRTVLDKMEEHGSRSSADEEEEVDDEKIDKGTINF